MLRVVRVISSVAVAWITRLLILRTALSIGIERSQILFFGGILVGIFVAWQFVWKAKMWRRTPEDELDTMVDVE
jgi:hypothetical protein